MPRISADILGPLCHGYKNRANCHGYLRISRVNATDISLRSIPVALTRDIRRYPWHWHDFCIVPRLSLPLGPRPAPISGCGLGPGSRTGDDHHIGPPSDHRAISVVPSGIVYIFRNATFSVI